MQAYSGLEYANARFYDPVMGAFLTHDPAAQMTNTYTYTAWDPVNRIDPSGEFWAMVGQFVVVGLISGVIGAALSMIAAARQGASVGEVFKTGALDPEEVPANCRNRPISLETCVAQG